MITTVWCTRLIYFDTLNHSKKKFPKTKKYFMQKQTSNHNIRIVLMMRSMRGCYIANNPTPSLVALPRNILAEPIHIILIGKIIESVRNNNLMS